MRERLSDSLTGEEKANKHNGKANSVLAFICSIDKVVNTQTQHRIIIVFFSVYLLGNVSDEL